MKSVALGIVLIACFCSVGNCQSYDIVLLKLVNGTIDRIEAQMRKLEEMDTKLVAIGDLHNRITKVEEQVNETREEMKQTFIGRMDTDRDLQGDALKKLNSSFQETITTLQESISTDRDLQGDALKKLNSSFQETITTLQESISTEFQRMKDSIVASSTGQSSKFQQILSTEGDRQGRSMDNVCSKEQLINLQKSILTEILKIDMKINQSPITNAISNLKDLLQKDECEDLNTCSVNASCTDAFDSYACTCLPGFHGNGHNCTDVDECSSRSHTCDHHAQCDNTIGSYSCSCLSGYTGNGFTCDEPPCVYPSQVIEGLRCVTPVREQMTYDQARSNCRSLDLKMLQTSLSMLQTRQLKEYFHVWIDYDYVWIGPTEHWRNGKLKSHVLYLDHSPPTFYTYGNDEKFSSLCQVRQQD